MKRLGWVVGVLLCAGCLDLNPDGSIALDGGKSWNSWTDELAKSGLHDENAAWLGGPPGGHKDAASVHGVAAANRGKKGSYVGYVHSVKVSGNRAAIEVVARIAGEGAQRCSGIEPDFARLSCVQKKRGAWRSAVVCHVNNWSHLHAATNGRLKADADNVWSRASNWAHVAVVGTVGRVERRSLTASTILGGYSDFGPTDHTVISGFAYPTIHLNNCRVGTYRSKAVAR